MCIYRRGQLGLGELESEEQPVLIEALAGIKVSANVFAFLLVLVLNGSFHCNFR